MAEDWKRLKLVLSFPHDLLSSVLFYASPFSFHSTSFLLQQKNCGILWLLTGRWYLGNRAPSFRCFPLLTHVSVATFHCSPEAFGIGEASAGPMVVSCSRLVGHQLDYVTHQLGKVSDIFYNNPEDKLHSWLVEVAI